MFSWNHELVSRQCRWPRPSSGGAAYGSASRKANPARSGHVPRRASSFEQRKCNRARQLVAWPYCAVSGGSSGVAAEFRLTARLQRQQLGRGQNRRPTPTVPNTSSRERRQLRIEYKVETQIARWAAQCAVGAVLDDKEAARPRSDHSGRYSRGLDQWEGVRFDMFPGGSRRTLRVLYDRPEGAASSRHRRPAQWLRPAGRAAGDSDGRNQPA